MSIPLNHVFALSGSSCTASGPYNPTAAIPVAPNNIVGLFAETTSSITATGAVTITANPAANSYGAWSDGADSQINFETEPVKVTTSGGSSYGFYASGGGTITAPNTLSIATTANGSIGVYATGAGSTITVGGASITTGGLETPGALAVSGGNVTLDGGSVTTTGDGSFGVAALLSGSSITATGTTITTSGNVDVAGVQPVDVWVAGTGAMATLTDDTLTASGVQGLGVLATSGATATISGGSITVSNTDADGVLASGSGSEISISGGTQIVSSATPLNFVIAGAQAENSAILNLTDTAISTSGAGTSGVDVEGAATANLLRTTITTTGSDASAVVVDGVVEGVASTATLSGANVLTTSGDGSIGLSATGGGVINATGPITISTGDASTSTGLGAYGANADGAGSQINLAAATITTLGMEAYGLYASSGGTISAPDAPSVTTSGAGAIGLYASGAGSTITAGGASVGTSGDSAPGVQADSGGLVTLNGTTVLNTTGNGSIGFYATGGGVINATGPITISTSGTTSASTGLGAFGVNADGAGSQINLAAATITTAGQGAVGLYASDAKGTGSGGAITVSGQLAVTTGGPAAYGAWAQSAGSTIALNGPSTFTINGAAYALYATQGGAISTAGALGVAVNGDGAGAGGIQASGSASSVTLNGLTTIALNGSQNTGLLAASGGAILAPGPTSITVSGAQSTGVQALSGSITASGALNVTTSQSSSAGFSLGGTSPSILATGGGTVLAAGNAIDFINATGAVATFDGFSFASTAGDLIYAEPSTATVNFNNTVANAGAGNLLDATLGSVVTLNASASTLTGAIETDATSTTNVSLTNGTTWNMTASSTATSLNVADSAVMFSAPGAGGFKALTVGSYVGNGASLTLNTMLGGSNSPTDQLIVNAGSATGSTTLTIKNAGGTGAQTTGAGIPVVVAVNGGTTAANAFQLANTPVVGGYQYSLGRDAANQDWYLTSSPASTLGDIQNSVTSLAKSQLNQMTTTRLLGSLLLGANQQINSCSCGGGFASIGSFALGSAGRWSLNDNVTLLGGASFDQYYQDGTNVRAAPIVAASLRYDPTNWGSSRPFFEFGGALSPYIAATYTRYYTDGLIPATGVGSAVDRGVSVFGRVGWVARFTPIDEGAVFVDLVRGWQQTGGYAEGASALNPFPATVSTGLAREDIVRVGAQYTHLLFGNLEVNVNAAVAYGFDNNFGSQVSVVDFGSIAPYPLLNSAWTEFGGRLAYRFSHNLVADAFVLGTLGGEIGPTLHVGLGVRYAF